MAAESGSSAIKRLFFASLLLFGAIACSAIYIVLSPQPAIKPRAEQPSRTLAYEQKISRSDEAAPASEDSSKATAPAEATAQTAPEPAQSGPAPQPAPSNDAQAASAVEQSVPAPKEASVPPLQEGSPDMAALPPEEAAREEEPYDPDALPWQRGGRPYYPPGPGDGQQSYDPNGLPPGEDAYPRDPNAPLPEQAGYPTDPDGLPPGEVGYPADPNAVMPGPNDDPNAWPGGPQEEPQEWVQVLVSGAGMHGAASEDAPALFVFPYGRALRVVSRYGNWVEVTDPQSATTGWMKAQYLAPMAAPRQPGQQEAWYGEEPPRRRGWLSRNTGGLTDIISRALGGR